MGELQDQHTNIITQAASATGLCHEATAEQETSSKTVMIPDLFESFGSRTPVLNPHYSQINEEAVEWASR